MEVTEHILLSVAAKYGKDSHEYEMAGAFAEAIGSAQFVKPCSDCL
jgi:hypothetical protein